jgi:hypothetical protein
MTLRWFFYQYRTHFKTLFLSFFPDKLLRGNLRFKNVHAGERCFILGSGHSISEQDLTKLSGEIVMTQNHFHAHKDIGVIRPKYHVLIPKYQPTDFDNDWRTWFNSMNERLPGNCEIFMDKNTKYLIDEMQIFSERVHYISTGLSDTAVRKAPVDLVKPIMMIPTVLTECLAIAIYMGFKEIYLLGFDLDQNIQLARGGDRNQIRFYGKSPITANKFESNYESVAAKSGHDWFSMWTIWQQCGLLKKTAEERGVKIVNVTRGGVLNVFDRAVYEDLFL